MAPVMTGHACNTHTDNKYLGSSGWDHLRWNSSKSCSRRTGKSLSRPVKQDNYIGPNTTNMDERVVLLF